MRLKIIIVIQLLIISQIYAHCAEINFIYTSNLGGEIESCGCSGSGITGLAKRNTLVSTIKTEQSIHLECGDAFFRKHTIPEDEISQKKLKAKFTRDCLDLSKIDAYIPGDRDFAAGSDFLFDELIPKMKTSTLAANIGMTKCKAINKSGLKILLVGLCQGPTKSTKAWTSEKLAVKDLVSSLRSVIDGQEKTADLIIAIVHGKREDIERIAKAKLANIIIDGSGRESPKEPETIGGTIIVAAPRDGRFIGQLTLKSEKWARGEIEFSNKYISVSSKLKDDPEISALIAQYKNELIKLYSSETRKWKKPSKPTYWFDNVCGYCHPDQMDFWKTTRHAKAIKTLEKRKAHMDKECIGCHTIGFKKEGGWTHPIHLKTLPTFNVKSVMHQVPFIKKAH